MIWTWRRDNWSLQTSPRTISQTRSVSGESGTVWGYQDSDVSRYCFDTFVTIGLNQIARDWELIFQDRALECRRIFKSLSSSSLLRSRITIIAFTTSWRFETARVRRRLWSGHSADTRCPRTSSQHQTASGLNSSPMALCRKQASRQASWRFAQMSFITVFKNLVVRNMTSVTALTTDVSTSASTPWGDTLAHAGEGLFGKLRNLKVDM